MNCLILSLTVVDAVRMLFTAENIFPSNVAILFLHRFDTENYALWARATELCGWQRQAAAAAAGDDEDEVAHNSGSGVCLSNGSLCCVTDSGLQVASPASTHASDACWFSCSKLLSPLFAISKASYPHKYPLPTVNICYGLLPRLDYIVLSSRNSISLSFR